MKDIPFKALSQPVEAQLNKMVADATEGKCILLRAPVSGDTLYELYLSSFPEGANPIFRERTAHDCNCCKTFIRRVGNMVAMYDHGDGYRFETIWDAPSEGYYDTVSRALYVTVSDAIRKQVVSPLFPPELFVVRDSYALKPGSGPTPDNHNPDIIWNHFTGELPRWLHVSGPEFSRMEAALVTAGAVSKWDINAVKDVQELIASGSLYRGEQYKVAVDATVRFLSKKFSWVGLGLIAWAKRDTTVAHIKNSSIGQLIEKYIETGNLEVAVSSYEAMVAPSNYKRTTAITTPRMIEEARRKVEELGLTDSLTRRLALVEDIPATAVLYSQASAAILNPTPFDVLQGRTVVRNTNTSGVVKTTFEKFMEHVVPTIQSLEMLVNPQDASKLVTMLTAVDPQAPSLFAWNNPFSWAYTGDVTDSVKQRVKAAGGKVDGDVRISLSWFAKCDLDLHLRTRCGHTYDNHVYFSRKRIQDGNIELDVDMNIYEDDAVLDPVENIVFHDLSKVLDGEYSVYVDNFTRRNPTQDFNIEVEYDGQTQVFGFSGSFPGQKEVLTLHVMNGKIVTLSTAKNISRGGRVGEVGGLPGQTWAPVQYIMQSPNAWADDPVIGIEHYFFMLEGLKMEEPVRAFFNEQLRGDLQPHRKVFEQLGASAAMIETEGQRQLTGLGFNKQQGGTVTLRAKGKTTRTYEVSF